MFAYYFGSCLLAITLLLVAVVVVIVLRAFSLKKPYTKKSETIIADEEETSQKLSNLIKIETVCGEQAIKNTAKFFDTLQEQFPLFFSSVEKFEVGRSRVFYLRGNETNQPLTLVSHFDVAKPSDEEGNAFCGNISEGYVHGRGAIDDKSSIVAMLEATEIILKEGYTPRKGVLYVMLADEEIDGDDIKKITGWFKLRNTYPGLVLDEGGFIIDKPLDGVEGKFALIGVSERSSCDMLIRAKTDNGQQSMEKLAMFIKRAGKMRLGKPILSHETLQMLKNMLPFMELPQKALFANLWLFKPILRYYVPRVNALAKAMIMPTISFSSPSGKVIDGLRYQESAVFATLMSTAHHNIDKSIDKIHKLACKFDLEIDILGFQKAPIAEKTSNAWFDRLSMCVEKTFQDVVPTPFSLFGNTASRHFAGECECVLRFSPFYITREQYLDFHAKDEKITTKTLAEGVGFYYNLIKMI